MITPRYKKSLMSLAVACWCVASAYGGSVLDQQQLLYNGGLSARTLPGYKVWQSFTAGVSGTLTEIDMGFFNDMSGDGQLQIFSGEGIQGNLLQTLTVPVVGLTQTPVTWNAWMVNVQVEAGHQYTFCLTPNAATLPDPYGVAVGSPNPYGGGVLNGFAGNFDAVFRTYVIGAVTSVGFESTGSLATERSYHTATRLLGGKVLVAGGQNNSGGIYADLASAELYDPATATWTATGSLGNERSNHIATLLPNGKVLVAGGSNGSSGAYLASAELYDPATGNWSATGSLITGRSLHAATLLSSGKVLVAGGHSNISGNLASAELYDPATGNWSATGSLTTERYYYTATLLPNGKVLAAGGYNDSGILFASAELYDPATGNWSATGSLATARYFHRATLLPNGKVLVAGGDDRISFLASAELYDPANGSWSATGSLATARHNPAATLLPNGKVLVAGGDDSGFNALASAELYDPASGNWSATGSMVAARGVPTATLLLNGKVLVAAGNDSNGGYLATAELYGGQPTPTILGNISTRLRVETGNNVLIGGFIVTGTQPKKVIVRAIGPSLSSFFPGTLTDPILELRDSSGGLIMSNDNWRSNQEAEIMATTIPPSNDLESAIVATLPANNSAYTAIVRGMNNGTGIGLVEAYDLDQTVDSKLANVSTRGLVQSGDNALIAGTIVIGQASQRVLIRAIGPSLNLTGELADPTLELRDGDGALIAANDNWRSDQETEITATAAAPANDLESAIIATLPASGASYTAIVRGVNGTTGVVVVEVYALN